MAASAADSRPTDSRWPDEPDRVSGGYGICVGRAAAAAFRALAERARQEIAMPRRDGRNAPWLADVPSSDQSFWLQRKSGSAEDAGAARVRTEALAGRVQSDCRQLARFFHVHRFR